MELTDAVNAVRGATTALRQLDDELTNQKHGVDVRTSEAETLRRTMAELISQCWSAFDRLHHRWEGSPETWQGYNEAFSAANSAVTKALSE